MVKKVMDGSLLVELALQESTSNTPEPFVSDDNLRSNSTRAEFDTVSTQNLSCLVSLPGDHPDNGSHTTASAAV